MNDQTDNLEPLVLIVENNDDNRQMLKVLLELWGYQVVEAADGEESINIAVSNRPNLILMDVSLSKTDDGLNITRRMREIDSLCSVPIVFTSGHAQPEFRALALAQGGNDYLVKPIDFNELETVLSKFTGKDNAKNNLEGIAV